MSKIVVIYQSKYGSTEKYAGWLAEELSCDLIKTKEAKIEQVEKYDVCIIGGGLYASGIAGLSFLKKNYEKLKNKTLIVFAVGASPYEQKAFREIKEHNLKSPMDMIPFFYFRGAWDQDKMTFTDRTMCNMLKKMVAKKDSNTLEPWEKALMEAIDTNQDWADKECIKPIVDLVRSKTL